MLKDRVLATLKFFDLQDYPLTLLELYKFLLADVGILKNRINVQWELIENDNGYDGESESAGLDQIARCLEEECQAETEQKDGFYCLPGRSAIISRRLASYFSGIKREQRISGFIGAIRHLPFVRGVGLTGSQAQGAQKKDSDIDLLIIAEPNFLWLARTLATAYFQILGLRRHGRKITNRFCLNHYLAGVKTISEFRNLYTAWEYAKLRPLVYPQTVGDFQNKNRHWIAAFFPNFGSVCQDETGSGASSFQRYAERALSGKFGQWLEKRLCAWQLPKIRQEEFILVREDELSFHPQSKQRELLQRFFALN